jgi:hypothetical protein
LAEAPGAAEALAFALGTLGVVTLEEGLALAAALA